MTLMEVRLFEKNLNYSLFIYLAKFPSFRIDPAYRRPPGFLIRRPDPDEPISNRRIPTRTSPPISLVNIKPPRLKKPCSPQRRRRRI